MSILRNPTQFRRVGAGLALIVASVMFVVADLIAPAFSDDTTEYLTEVADSTGAQAAAGLLQVFAFPLLVVGVLAVAHLIRGRGVILAHLGAFAAVIGLGAFPALAVTGVIDSVAVDTIGVSQSVALVEDGFEDSTAAIVLLVLILLPSFLAAVLIGAAVWRSALAPWWIGAAIIAGIVLLFAGSSQALRLAGDVLHLIGFGYLGVRMLKMSDAEWDRPPTDWREGSDQAQGAGPGSPAAT